MPMKTAYYTDQDIERFMFRSEIRLKNLFYVLLVCSIICQCCIWFVLLTETLDLFSFYFLLISSVFVVLCMVGLWYCYYSSKQERINYEKMRKEQQREVNSLIDELEKIRQNK